jgi:hypothetical protein
MLRTLPVVTLSAGTGQADTRGGRSNTSQKSQDSNKEDGSSTIRNTMASPLPAQGLEAIFPVRDRRVRRGHARLFRPK